MNWDGVLPPFNLQTLGMLFIILFVARVWATLRRAEGNPAWLSATALVAGVIFNAASLGATAAERAIDLGAGHGLDVSAAVGLVDLNGAFFRLGAFAALLFLAAVAAVTLRWHALPAWLGWSAAVIATLILVGQAIGTGRLGQGAAFLFVFWMLATSVVLLIRPEPSRVSEPIPVAAAP